jgi:uncharacterized membrane protein HdeD (DUF308 family)
LTVEWFAVGPGRVANGCPSQATDHISDPEVVMILLGVILLIIGFVASVPIIWTLGIILVVVGAILALLGGTGRAVGGRRHWY